MHLSETIPYSMSAYLFQCRQERGLFWRENQTWQSWDLTKKVPTLPTRSAKIHSHYDSKYRGTSPVSVSGGSLCNGEDLHSESNLSALFIGLEETLEDINI